MKSRTTSVFRRKKVPVPGILINWMKKAEMDEMIPTLDEISETDENVDEEG